MPFVPASPTRLFTRRQSTNKMKKLKKSGYTRDGQLSKDDSQASQTNADVLVSNTEVSSKDIEEHEADNVMDSQQDIYAALADATTEQDSSAPARHSILSEQPDDASESEYSIEEETQPVMGRASSVKVGRPTIVQHKATKQSKLQVTNMDSIQELSDRDSSARPTSDRRPSAISQAASTVSVHAVPSSQAETAATNAVTSQIPPALPTGSTLHSIHPVIADAGSSAEMDQNKEGHQLDVPDQGINRAMSSPLPTPGKGLLRRVSIRPSDLIIRNHDRDGPGSSTFRETVVTTPYPGRMSSPGDDDVDLKIKDNRTRDSNTTKTNEDKSQDKHKVAFLNSPGSKDRFPSPARPETLFLDINLARHPSMRTTIEVQITDRSLFDDEMLFNQIRAAYYTKLLGTARYTLLLVRRLGNVVVPAQGKFDASEFNSIDFIKHLHNPSLGKKRKAWVIWLRNNNPRRASLLSTLSRAPVHPGPARHIDNINRRSLRANSRRSSRHEHSDLEKDHAKQHKRSSSDASSFLFSYSPALPRLPFAHIKDKPNSQPESPAQATHGSPVRSFFWPSHLSSSLSTASKMACNASEPDNENDIITTLSFHHEYRPVMISLLTLLNILVAVMAGVLWVVFGVPGTRPGTDGQFSPLHMDEYKFGQAVEQTSWRVEAGHRVLTGIVIGIAVLFFGCVVEGALVWMSWLLL